MVDKITIENVLKSSLARVLITCFCNININVEYKLQLSKLTEFIDIIRNKFKENYDIELNGTKLGECKTLNEMSQYIQSILV